MTPKEKAEDLLFKFSEWNATYNALIAVNEIIAQIEPSVTMDVISARIKYWQEVKQEIEKYNL